MTVRALDQAEINSTIAAVAIAVAVSLGATAALSVAASLAQNEIGNTTLATMDGRAGAPAITVKADSQAAITTVSVAVSVSAPRWPLARRWPRTASRKRAARAPD